MRIWLQWAPRTGWRLSALIRDLDAFDGNPERTVAALHLCNMRLRAHAQSHRVRSALIQKVNVIEGEKARFHAGLSGKPSGQLRFLGSIFHPMEKVNLPA